MRSLKRFSRDERGISAVEFALMLPILLAVLVGSVTVFDVFRMAQSAEKSTFTVGDMLSREQNAITDTKLDYLVTFLGQTVDYQGTAALRVSSISKSNGRLVLDWSRVRGDTTIPRSAIPYDIIPDIAPGDSVILTETFVPHRAFVDWFGLDRMIYNHRSVHRPRFVGRIAFQ